MTPPATPEAEMPRVQGDEIERQWKVLETGFTDREWLPETPFYFRGGVATAFDEETFDTDRERERLAGEIDAVGDWINRLPIPTDGAGSMLTRVRHLAAAIRASEPVPGAEGMSVEEIAQTLYLTGRPDHTAGGWGTAEKRLCEERARAVLALLTPRTVEPDPASGADAAVAQATIAEIIRQDGEMRDDGGMMLESVSAHYVYLDALLIARAAILAARPSSPRDVGEAETAEIMPRLGGVANWHATAVLERRKRRSAEARVADLERQIAGAESYIKATLKFYDDLDAPHHPGEARVLDELATFLASLNETSRGE